MSIHKRYLRKFPKELCSEIDQLDKVQGINNLYINTVISEV